ncbi:MAG: ADP-ribosylglycohydrolase family protein [Chthoniobacteraceae bacterium]
MIAPGNPHLAGRLAREFGQINGCAEAVDGAVFVAGAVSLAFAQNDPKSVVREAAALIHPESPYRRCLDEIIAFADAGKSFEEISCTVIERWCVENPGTNNAVANGGIIALCVWFGEGDFLKTVNLALRAADYTDADCTAAGAAAVVGALGGLKAIPQDLREALHDRIFGDKMGDLPLPLVDESISAHGQRTAAFGEKMLLAHGAHLDGDTLVVPRETPQPLPLERFTLADLTRYWRPEWTLERAGFGATVGGRGGYPGGYPGGTWLADGVLTT